VIRNFEHSLRCAEGEFIFLCDQDDVWEPDKVARALDVLRDRNVSLLVHDAILIDGSGERIMNSFFEFRGSRPGFVKNMVRNSFLGCCMVFRRSILDWVLPFPDRIPMHDWWIGLICELKGNVRFIDDKLMRYRRHNENVTAMHHSPLKEMIRYRWSLSCALLARMLRTVR